MPNFDVTCETRELKLRKPFTISRGTKETVSNAFVTLSANGVRGYGEAAPNARYGESAEDAVSFIEELPEAFFEDIETAEQLTEALDLLPRPVKSAMAAIETAWLDWYGKTECEPLWKLWNAPSNTTPPTSYTIGLDTIENIRENVRSAAGFPVLKVKLGSERDREIIRAIREVTTKPVRVDVNEGWADLDTAKKNIDFLAGEGVELVEQPMPSAMIEQTAALKQWSPLPLVADESFTGNEDLDVIAGAFHGINIKLMKTGSLVKSRHIIAEARARGLTVMVGCMIESSLANAAGALLGLWADYVDLDGHLLISNDPAEGLTLNSDKCLVLNDRPGLGIGLDA